MSYRRRHSMALESIVNQVFDIFDEQIKRPVLWGLQVFQLFLDVFAQLKLLFEGHLSFYIGIRSLQQGLPEHLFYLFSGRFALLSR